jgi:hypothetical protein
MHYGGTVGGSTEPRWLLLIHQIPPKPNYLRVKIWRRLQRLGAAAVKNSVYVLPRSDQAQEDFQWVAREIAEGGGDASICEAHFVDGLTDAQVVAMFHAARDADYAQIAETARGLLGRIRSGSRISGEQRAQADSELARLRRRAVEVSSIDFLGAPGRLAVDKLLGDLEGRLRAAKRERPVSAASGTVRKRTPGHTWVTRKGIHVDRMASAWLIMKFIDTKARFKFVPGKAYLPLSGETRFDMFEAEFTHEGDRCTFEVLIEKFRLDDRALRPIARIVHDIDLKDSKFGRPEVPGIERLVAGIALSHREDDERLARGSAVFEDLHEYFRKMKGD